MKEKLKNGETYGVHGLEGSIGHVLIISKLIAVLMQPQNSKDSL